MQMFWFSVNIDGKLDYCVLNAQPKSFNKVTLWASNPWHMNVNGLIENLKLRTVNNLGKIFFKTELGNKVI